MILLVFLLLGTFGTTFSDLSLMDFDNVWELRPGKTVIPLKSLMYPDPTPGNIITTWKISTHPSAVIRLTCYNLYIPPLQDGACNSGIYIFTVRDGERYTEYCGQHIGVHFISHTNKIYLFHRTSQIEGGAINCSVQAFKMKDDSRTTVPPTLREQDEFDSSEHGGPPGIKSTNCTCGWANKGELKVIGGKETDVNEYPFNVGLSSKGGKRTFCGGSIISPFHVLTSAHCVINHKDNPQNVEVLIGEHNYNKEGETSVSYRVPVSRMELHETYIKDKKPSADIAVLVLDKEIKFSKQIGPVCLPHKQLHLEGQYVKIIGWGRTLSKGWGSEFVKEVNVKAVSIQQCSACFWSHVDLKNPRLLCTFTKLKGIGLGDSGGPVVWLNPETNRYTLVGLPALVFLYDKDLHRCPDMSTDVSTYLDWIHERIKITNPRGATCAVEE